MKKRFMSMFVVLIMIIMLTPSLPARERHPQIRAAISSLRDARAHLQEAAHDFGGHKAEAIRATDEAIHQLEICLRYDN